MVKMYCHDDRFPLGDNAFLCTRLRMLFARIWRIDWIKQVRECTHNVILRGLSQQSDISPLWIQQWRQNLLELMIYAREGYVANAVINDDLSTRLSDSPTSNRCLLLPSSGRSLGERAQIFKTLRFLFYIEILTSPLLNDTLLTVMLCNVDWNMITWLLWRNNWDGCGRGYLKTMLMLSAGINIEIQDAIRIFGVSSHIWSGHL